MVSLPRKVALKSQYQNKYLRYVNEACEVHSFLQYSSDSILTPYTMYEIEQAKCDSSLVHIRCSYNNKYWVKKSPTEDWIVAEADKIEEDKSKWNCTLFQPEYNDHVQGFKFRMVYQDNYLLCSQPLGPPYTYCLRGMADCGLFYDYSTVVDLGTLLSIPKYVAFKGDNGQYLCGRWIEGHQYLQFDSSDIGEPSVGMETFITKDGNIRLKSNYFEKFWRRSPNWIWADSTDTTTNDPDTLFLVTKGSTNNVVGLRNMGNNNFIKRLTTEGKTSCLNAAVKTMDIFSRLQLEELVISREIYNVKFRPLDSRIYDQCALVMATETASNGTLVPNTMDLKLSYTETKSSTWSSSISMKLGVKTTIETGIPFIAKGNIEISAEFSGSYEWGETKTTSKTMETTYQVTVPPMTMVIVSLLAAKGTSDVPYSYTQRDTLFDGKIQINQMDDGVYTGINNYNFKYETKSMPITI